MARNYAKRDLMRSLDLILYMYFIYEYLLDAGIFVMILRCLLQLFLSPKTLTRTLRSSLYIITISYFLSVMRHIFLQPQLHGVIIDFIGNVHRPSKYYLFWLDTVIFVLQTTLLVIIFLEAPRNLASSRSRSSSRSDRTASTHQSRGSRPSHRRRASSDELDQEERSIGVEEGDIDEPEDSWENELVVDIQLRQALRNWMYAEDDGAGEGLRGRERRARTG